MTVAEKQQHKSTMNFFTDDPILSIDAACIAAGGISKWTLYGKLSRNELKRTKVGGRTMIRASELQKLVRE